MTHSTLVDRVGKLVRLWDDHYPGATRSRGAATLNHLEKYLPWRGLVLFQLWDSSVGNHLPVEPALYQPVHELLNDGGI